MKGGIPLRPLMIATYVSTVALVLMAAGLFVYREHEKDLRLSLAERLREVASPVSVTRADVVVGPPGFVGELGSLAAGLVELNRGSALGIFVMDATGQVVEPVSGDPSVMVADAHAAVRSDRQSRLIEPTDENGRMAWVIPIENPGGRLVGTLEVSSALASTTDDLQRLARELGTAIVAGLVLAVVVGTLVSELFMRSIGGLLGTARSVAKGDFGRRASRPATREMRVLADTFNVMLDRLQVEYESQADRSAQVRRFATDASHELRSPVAVLHNGVGVLVQAMERGDEAEARDIAGVLSAETGRLARLVEDLLLLGRLSHPGWRMEKETIEPMPLVEEEHARARLLSQGQRVRLVWPRQPVNAIEADREMVRRALHNVIENALRATAPGSEVTITAMPDPVGVRFVVRDQGAGIEPAELPHIFEPFYQASHSTERDKRGTGLGLSIVRAIVSAHAGRIEVMSAPAKGTRIDLIFPGTIQRRLSPPSGRSHERAVTFVSAGPRDVNATVVGRRPD